MAKKKPPDRRQPRQPLPPGATPENQDDSAVTTNVRNLEEMPNEARRWPDDQEQNKKFNYDVKD